MALAKDSETGEEKSLPALALWRDPSDGTGHWRRAVVLQYDLVGEKFEVQYEDWCTECNGRASWASIISSDHTICRQIAYLHIDVHIYMYSITMMYSSDTMTHRSSWI